MIYQHTLSLVIPCRNEAQGIGRLVASVPKVVDEIIVVDNGSSDRTAAAARKAGARVVKETRTDRSGIGYGYALQKGMMRAKGDLIITMDGDGTYPVGQIRSAVRNLLSHKYDFLICSRFPLRQGRAISWLRRLGVAILNAQARRLYGYPVLDILSGMWVVRRSVLKSLNLQEGGWNLSPEIKLTAIRLPGVAVGQFHIDHYRRDHGSSKQQIWQTGLTHLWYIFWRFITRDAGLAVWGQRWVERVNQLALRMFF